MHTKITSLSSSSLFAHFSQPKTTTLRKPRSQHSPHAERRHPNGAEARFDSVTLTCSRAPYQTISLNDQSDWTIRKFAVRRLICEFGAAFCDSSVTLCLFFFFVESIFVAHCFPVSSILETCGYFLYSSTDLFEEMLKFYSSKIFKTVNRRWHHKKAPEFYKYSIILLHLLDHLAISVASGSAFIYNFFIHCSTWRFLCWDQGQLVL